jgi:hypothetical protein
MLMGAYVRRAWWISIGVVLCACFPTFQSPRIDPGFHADIGLTYITDQTRNDEPQGPDLMIYAAPTFGFGDRVEVGVPVGVYLEEGLQGLGSDIDQVNESPRTLALWPYLKFALLPSEARDHLALLLQGVWLLPANVGLRYGRDLGSWEPHAGVSVIFSGGPAGDDPFVTRYQEKGQLLLSAAVGATWNVSGRPAIELGVLRNRYEEGAVYGDFGQPTTTRTLYDLFVGGRVRLP